MQNLPDTLVEAIRVFADQDVCRRFVAAMRWPDGVKCPRCGCDRVTFMESVKRWNCKGCRKQFSVKIGTIFEESPLELDKWLIAFWMATNSKNGVSSHELCRTLGIMQKSTWFVLYRVRYALQTGSLDKMTGTVEYDESYVGQKAKTMHYDKKKEKIKGRGTDGKTLVFGLLERGQKADKEWGIERRISKVRIMVVQDTKEETIVGKIKDNVEAGTEVFTDAHKSYRGLTGEGFKHAFVDHAIRYVEGRVHSNGIENFWGQMDRMMHGTYTYALPHHLFRYTDELAFRFNHRDGTDLTRFLHAMQQISGKRLTYDTLTTSHLKSIMPVAA